jgi:DNA topoisomerase-1
MTRLVTVTRDDLSITRRRRGKGFVYINAAGRPVKSIGFRARARSLGIPPAWTDVRISDNPRAHLQCCGTDDAGRVQYIYHPDWELKRTQRKEARLKRLTDALPAIRRRVGRDLGAEPGSKELALALAVALIDKTAMRVGRERYLEERGTRGAGTLFDRDVRVSNDDVYISFPAKSGKVAEYHVADARLADAITRIKTLKGERLLEYRGADGKMRPIKAQMISDYLHEISGADISGKDFRTLHASALAAQALSKLEPGASESARKRQIAGVSSEIAAFLRNTPMICRKSYIAPILFRLFDTGKLRALWEAAATTNGPRSAERRLGALLAAA